MIRAGFISDKFGLVEIEFPKLSTDNKRTKNAIKMAVAQFQIELENLVVDNTTYSVTE